MIYIFIDYIFIFLALLLSCLLLIPSDKEIENVTEPPAEKESVVYEIKEPDYENEFDYLICQFYANSWNANNYNDKLLYINQLTMIWSNELGCNCPQISFLEEPIERLSGSYDFTTNTMFLNPNYLNNGTIIYQTIAHEVRHAWQDYNIEQNTEIGKLFLDNLQGEYVSGFDDYKTYCNQLGERDAFDYENQKFIEYQKIIEKYY